MPSCNFVLTTMVLAIFFGLPAPAFSQEFTIDDLLAEIESCDDPSGVIIKEKFARRVAAKSDTVLIGYGDYTGNVYALSFDMRDIDQAEIEGMNFLKFSCKYAGCITSITGINQDTSKRSADKRKFTSAKIAMCSEEYNELLHDPFVKAFPLNEEADDQQ